MDQHRRSKSSLGERRTANNNNNLDEGGVEMGSLGGVNKQMTTRRSELELRNECVNQEMKSLFKQVVNNNNNNETNSDTNNNTITLNVVHGKQQQQQQQTATGIATASNSLIYTSVNPAKIVTHKPSNANLLARDNFNVNFNNAVFNKNFTSQQQQQQQQQQQHNDSAEMTHDVTLFSNNISTSDVHLSDDLSMLPVIDDKTLLSSLKAKFEMRKYFVS